LACPCPMSVSAIANYESRLSIIHPDQVNSSQNGAISWLSGRRRHGLSNHTSLIRSRRRCKNRLGVKGGGIMERGAFERLRGTASRAIALAFQSMRHWGDLQRLSDIPEPQLIQRFLRERPEIRRMVLTPLISARWDAKRRLEIIREHFRIVGQLGGVLAVGPGEFIELVNLSGIKPGLHATIDAPRWLLRDGILAVSLWLENKRIYTISFCLGYEGGWLVARVGGVQGVANNDAGALYRELTKAAAGIRPRDLLFEIFRSLCRHCGIVHILGISDTTRHHFSAYNTKWIGIDPVNASYDEAWRDRGGHLRDDGFFVIPTKASVRSDDQVPPKKRSMYRTRYRMLDYIAAELGETLALNPLIQQHPNLGHLTRPEATKLLTATHV